MHILYLTHDLSDTTTEKRARMLRAGGANVTLAGFSRSTPPAIIAGCPVVCFGKTSNGRFLARAFSVIRTIATLRRYRALFQQADLVIARNLESLAIAARGQRYRHTPLVYEVLDIHRLLLRKDALGQFLRRLEGRLSKRVSLVLTSSPAYIREYFEKRSHMQAPCLLLENKVFLGDGMVPQPTTHRPPGPPWRIGWFGIIRCQKSLDILCDALRAHPGLFELIIRGKPDRMQFRDFDAQVKDVAGLHFMGAYTQADLPPMYGEVHFSWAIDMFEEGLNSQWLLPNRIYEGGLYGAVPLTASGVETSNLTARLGIGYTLGEPKGESLVEFLQGLNANRYQTLSGAVTNQHLSSWVSTPADCVQLVQQLDAAQPSTTPEESFAQRLSNPLPPLDTTKPALIVIPCLNEAKNIAPLVEFLQMEARTTPMTIVIADGGSTDGTVEIAQRLASTYTNLHYLHNPKRIQSAAINLAVKTYGDGHDALIRIDAHAYYPPGFVATLLRDAQETHVASVVVSMLTVGNPGFQEAVAAAQNSKLGNGGSAHRLAAQGKWVDHGHHALMRIAAFNDVQGYDESFSHNEDAELDTRLRKAGYRIWLSGNTSMEYFPRATPYALFKQYRNYGRGRVRTLLKHREKPKLRQLLPVAVLPAALLLLLSPMLWVAAIPFFAWAAFCIVYGVLLARNANRPGIVWSGPAAMLMHGGWSLGFWQGLVAHALGGR